MNLEKHNWLKEFSRRNKRPLRVLHVGNIANNAYLNAKILRGIGIEVDVLCYDYYHVMACPEWEDVEIHSYGGDDCAPRFSKQDLNQYRRPEWFVQGPLGFCIDYILRADKKSWQQSLIRYLLYITLKNQKLRRFLSILSASGKTTKILKRYFPFAKFQRLTQKQPFSILRKLSKNRIKQFLLNKSRNKKNNKLIDKIITEFDLLYPERTDRLIKDDISMFLFYADRFQKLFDRYDIIQCYSIDPILAMLFSKKPYVAFEHGTLRDFTMGDSPIHRLNSLAYRKADHVFITNGDCLEYARKLGITQFSAMIHPVDVEQHRQPATETKSDIKSKYQADILLFCPVRHDWGIKGTDVHIRALPLICQALPGKRVRLLTVGWGQELDRSRALIEELGCQENVIWLSPLCRLTMIKFMQAAEIVLDQMILPCFGATAPQALAVGTPVIMSYKPESTSWIVDEPAPIISAFTPEDVCRGVLQALDPEWLAEYKKRAHDWVNKEHHTNRIIDTHLEVYQKLIKGNHVK